MFKRLLTLSDWRAASTPAALLKALRTTLLTTLLTPLLVVGCGQAPENQGAPTNQNAQQSKTTPITIAQFGHVFLYMPLYVAVDQGFFKDEGLDVKLVSTGGDEKTFTAVSAGNAQFGVSDPVFAAIARERGQGGKVVAQIVGGTPFWIVTYKANIKPIVDPSQLAGLKIAAYTAPSTCYAVTKQLLQNGGKPVKAQIVQGAFGSLQAMLKSDQADAAMEIEPVVSTAVAAGGHIIYSPAAQQKTFAFTGLTVSDQYCQEHPEVIQHAVNAIVKAMNYIQTDSKGTFDVAKKEFPETDDKIIVAALKRMTQGGTTPKTPLLAKNAWANAIALRKELGDIKGNGAYEENVDMSFVGKALNK
jgi:NitT/TauT family transport system substrate-binding protein